MADRIYRTQLVLDSRSMEAGSASADRALARVSKTTDALAQHLQLAAQAGTRFEAQQQGMAAAQQRTTQLAQQQSAAFQSLTAAAAGQSRVTGAPDQLGGLQALANIRQAAQAQERREYQQHQSALDGIRAAAQAKQRADAQSQAQFLSGLERSASSIGKTRAELLTMEAAQRGVTAQAAPFIARIAQADRVTSGFARTGKLTAIELQQVGFQLNDLGVQLASGQSPLIALVQQGSQLSGTFGGVRPALAALGSLITPALVGFTGLAAVVGTVSVAFVQGQRDTARFENTLALTNNRVGLTRGQFDALTQSVSRSTNTTVGSAREMAQALAATGEIGAANFRTVTQAGQLMADKLGMNVEEVSKLMVRLARDPVQVAQELNRTYNFLSIAQFEQIRALQEQGRASDAAGVAAAALNEHLKRQQPELGAVQQQTRALTQELSGLWQMLLNIGKAPTPEQKVAETLSRLDLLRRGQAQSRTPERFNPAIAAQEQELRDQGRAALRAAENAAADAQRAEGRQAAIDASQFVQATLKKANSQNVLNAALAAGARHIKALNEERLREGGKPLSAADEKAVLAQIRKDNTSNGASGESEQRRLEAARAARDKAAEGLRFAQREAQRAQELAALEAQHERLLISDDVFAQRRAAIERSALAEKVALVDQEIEIEKRRTFTRDSDAEKRDVRLLELQRERVELKAREAAIDDGGVAFERAVAQNDRRVAEEANQRRSERIAAAAGASAELAELNKGLTASLISDDRARGQALLAIEVAQQRARISALVEGTDARREAEDRLAQYILLSERKLTEDLKPEWQRRLEAWEDVERRRQEVSDEINTEFVDGGREMFAQWFETGRLSFDSLKRYALRTLGEQFYERMGYGQALKQAGDVLFSAINTAMPGQGRLAIDTSGAGTVDTPSVARDALRRMEAAYDPLVNAIGDTTEATITATAKTVAESAATAAATGSIVALTQAANAAAAALATISAGSAGGAGGLGGLFGDLFGSVDLGGDFALPGFGDGLNLPPLPGFGGLFAKGGAFGRSGQMAVRRFAKGGAFTNQIIDRPTIFKYAKGSKFGEMGEAGPEAVLPLERGPGGRLGVRAVGGGGQAASAPVNFKLEIINNGTPQREVGRQMDGDTMRVFVEDVVAESIASGGKVARAGQGAWGLSRAGGLARRG
jgi:phage-related minor tail protein